MELEKMEELLKEGEEDWFSWKVNNAFFLTPPPTKGFSYFLFEYFVTLYLSRERFRFHTNPHHIVSTLHLLVCHFWGSYVYKQRNRESMYSSNTNLFSFSLSSDLRSATPTCYQERKKQAINVLLSWWVFQVFFLPHPTLVTTVIGNNLGK